MLSSEGKAAAAALQTVGLAAAGGNSPHVFAIKGNKKKKEWKEEEREEEEEEVPGTWRPDVSAGGERSL